MVASRGVVATLIGAMAVLANAAHAEVPLSGVSALAVGWSHACVLTAHGGVRCWGWNQDGQLGDGTTLESANPVDVVGLGAGVAAVAAGGNGTCALTGGGGVKCWGYTTLTPVDVPGLGSGVAAIAVGGYRSCAVTTTGGVKCWQGVSAPEDVPGLASGVAAVAIGWLHACALTTAGGMKCWGNNWLGQLGDGTTTSSPTPVDVIGLTGGVASIGLGWQHSCAVTAAGGAKCWGANSFGELGAGAPYEVGVPVDVAGLASGVAEIAGGEYFTCARLVSGDVKCWGHNVAGELGDGTTISRSTPAVVTGLPAGASTVALGAFHACARIPNGEVRCWGLNHHGQLGNAKPSTAPTAVVVAGLSAGTAVISAGARHTCALTAGGGARCWGEGLDGQLGLGSMTSALTPRDVFGLTSGLAAVAAGSLHSCALTSGGGVKCWGEGGSGQLGQIAYKSDVPLDVPGLASGVAGVAPGAYHTCALTTAGGVRCWGSNSYGQIGNGTTAFASHVPADVTGLAAGVVAVAAGGAHSCALLAGGGVRCWGYNLYGQLGDGTTTQALVPVDVIGLPAPVKAIGLGGYHTCAVLAEGTVKCWGYNLHGQLGNGTTGSAATPTDVAGLPRGATRIAAGFLHTCAAGPSGAVDCWGRNEFGQLGNGTTSDAHVPTAVVGFPAGATAIAAGEGHSCALTAVGGARCWGRNWAGELGNGVANYAMTPQAVVVAACADFTDVDPASAFCGNVDWLRNRGVTQGCTSTNAYCPGDAVIRLAMAAFMHRLGTALEPAVRWQRATSGPLDPGAAPVVCASADETATGFPRQIYLDGVFSGTAAADLGLAVDLVASFDGGSSWYAVNLQGQRGFVRANHWGNLRALGQLEVEAGQAVRFGLRVSRLGAPGGATLDDSTCNLRIRIDIRNGFASPF